MLSQTEALDSPTTECKPPSEQRFPHFFTLYSEHRVQRLIHRWKLSNVWCIIDWWWRQLNKSSPPSFEPRKGEWWNRKPFSHGKGDSKDLECLFTTFQSFLHSFTKSYYIRTKIMLRGNLIEEHMHTPVSLRTCPLADIWRPPVTGGLCFPWFTETC